jgi:hypothetical protein
VLLLATLLACGGQSDVAQAPRSGFDDSWLAAIAREPARFGAVVDKDRAGWIALHRNDWGAAARTEGPAAARAAGELAVMHGVLAGVSNDAWRALGTTWEQRGHFPTDSILPKLIALAAKDAGDATAQARWERLPGRTDPVVDERVALHTRIRKSSPDPALLLQQAREPMVIEASEAGPRPFWDPMLHLSLSQSHAAVIAATWPEDPLERSLFSGGVDPADGSPTATLAKLGLSLPPRDDADACREVARTFGAQLESWWVAFDAAHGSDESRALANDLQLVRGMRSRALVDWAVDAMGNDRPRCALVLAELALDHEHPREITPLNPPTLYAVLAHANLRTGRTREALDALEVLVTPFPETTGLDETVGDLAVLSGLDRVGDSREN